MMRSSTEILPDSAIVIPIEEDPNADPPPNLEEAAREKKIIGFQHRLFLIVPIVTATLQASQNVMDLESAKLTQPVTIIAPVLSFIASVGLSKRFTIGSIDKILKMWRTGKMPKSWPVLSRKQEIAALGMAGLINVYVVTNLSLQAYTYVKTFPVVYQFTPLTETGWIAFSFSVAGFVGFNTIMSQAWETYVTLRELIARKEISFFNKCSWVASLGIGVPLALISATNSYLNNNYNVIQYFSLKSLYHIIPVSIASLTHGFTDFCMNGRFRIQTIDSLVEYFSTQCVSLPDLLTFVSCGALAGTLAYYMHFANATSLESIFLLLLSSPDMIQYFSSGFSFGIMADDFVNNTASMVPLIKSAFEFLGLHATHLYQYATRTNSTPQVNEENPLLPEVTAIETPTEAPESESLGHSVHRLFAPKRAITPDIDEPEKSCQKSICTIL